VVDTTTPVPVRAAVAAPRRRGPLLGLAAAVVAIAVGLTLVGLRLGHDASVADRRDSALAAARQGVVNFTSLDYRSLDKQFKLIESEGTGSFLDDLKANEAKLRTSYTTDKITSQGSVLDAAVTASSARDATIVLFVDAILRAASVKNEVHTRYRARVHMVRSGSRWLVEEVTPVA
jgi:Mce-associated membrane protein